MSSNDPKPQHAWLGHVQPVGLVVAPVVLDELGLQPLPQSAVDNEAIQQLLQEDGPALADPWPFLEAVLEWPSTRVQGVPGGPPLDDRWRVSLRDGETLLEPHLAVLTPDGEGVQLLFRFEAPGVDLERRNQLDGWEATPHQRFERLLRETEVGAGVLIGAVEGVSELRLVVAPKGEASGWISWPLRSLGTVAGRPMLGGLKLLLDRAALFTNPPERRLPALLKASRARQAEVSTKLAGQVLAALHELLRGFDAAEPALIRELAKNRPHHLYEGLLTVLMRLVFILYAEDRDLLPSKTGDGGLELYERGYALRSLRVRLDEDAALNPDTMDERRGAWGQLLALFRLIHGGHRSGFMQARGGKLFDEREFPFLMGKRDAGEADRVPHVSDGCIHRVLNALMVVNGERLSYRTLDVEQIGSVYETVMGFKVEPAEGRSLAIAAGKNNKTPVFVDLDALAKLSAADRLKIVKEDTGRGQLGKKATAGVRAAAAGDVEALEAALGEIADPRGSPRAQAVAKGTPILQPTDERRRTGSHYTPRDLTSPIVQKALQPAFERLGEQATPEDVLSLKVCDPAMGSGAFLVEACRQIGDRLVKAWEAHPALKPRIPADEDDDLHARRLVAQRCLYGVDKNPMAVDLAKLSLWLATLARDHEFSFLDHALKCGDSLVGLSRKQLEGVSWEADPAPTLWSARVREDVRRALEHRDAIRNAPDDIELARQEAQHRYAEDAMARVRLIGDTAVAAFFAHDKDKARKEAVRALGGFASGNAWDELRAKAAVLGAGEHPIRPFHWEAEFPEVFGRENPGFDAIVGNPPFAGKNTAITGNRAYYLEWLQALHSGAHGNADLVAHFFRRAFDLLRQDGRFGLIATNTVGQGDTRETGLAMILRSGGTIEHAVRRLKWPGDAAVVVSVVHMAKGLARLPVLDGRQTCRISAYLVDGDLDGAPSRLSTMVRRSFQGTNPVGAGFLFDDERAKRGETSSLSDMREIMRSDPKSCAFIKDYTSGEDVANSPEFKNTRYLIDFGDLSEALAKESSPALFKILEDRVKPVRLKDNRDHRRIYWWKHGEPQKGLYSAISGLSRVLIAPQTSPHLAFGMRSNFGLYASTSIVIAMDRWSAFAALQSRVHEIWARIFASSMKDDLRYTPSDCFETFPLPYGSEASPELDAASEAYHAHRATVMATRNEGMTPTYNRFHDPDDQAEDIVELRRFHAEMDRAVLRAYGWDDLAEAAAPVFLTEETEDDHKYQDRLFWPAPFRDEVLGRLLKLNEERATAQTIEEAAE